MGALKTNWHDPIMPDRQDLEGSTVTHSGSEPGLDMGGPGGLKPAWDNPMVPTPGGEETANSVSGLPALPNRYEPTETPPSIPDLTKRNPGTIDKR